MNSEALYKEYFNSLGYNPDSFSSVKVLESNIDFLKQENCYGIFCSSSHITIFDKEYMDYVINDSIKSLRSEKTDIESVTSFVLSCLSKSFTISKNDLVFLENSVFDTFDSRAYESAILNEQINNSIESHKEINQEIQNMVHPNNDKKIDFGGMIVGGMIGGTAGAILGGTPTKKENPRYTPQYSHTVNKEDYVKHQQSTILKFWQDQKIISVTFERFEDTLFYSLKKVTESSPSASIGAHPEIVYSFFSDIDVPNKKQLLKKYYEKIDYALEQDDKSAMEYVNEALKLEPNDAQLWFKKCQAAWLLSTYGETLLAKIKEYADNAIIYNTDKENENFELTVYDYVINLCIRTMELAIGEINDCKKIKEINNNNVRIYGAWKAINITREADASDVSLYDSMAVSAINTVLSISDDVFIHHQNLLSSLSKFILQFENESNALMKRFKIYGAVFSKESQITRDSIKIELEKKYSDCKSKNKEYAEKKAKEQRDAYWEEHASEKALLNSQKVSAEEAITNLRNKMTNIPEINEIEKLHTEINILKKELQSISFFKSKDRNKIKSIIEEKQSQLSVLYISLDKQKSELTSKISEQEKIINRINREFAKEKPNN